MADKLSKIEKLLQGGAKLRAFSSSCHVTVVRIERDGELIGYGEGYLPSALNKIAKGAGDYAKQLGLRPLPRPVTLPEHLDPSGALYVSGGYVEPKRDMLDGWALSGRKLEIVYEPLTNNGVYILTLDGYGSLDGHPPLIIKAWDYASLMLGAQDTVKDELIKRAVAFGGEGWARANLRQFGIEYDPETSAAVR
jgi:hypothetical protein